VREPVTAYIGLGANLGDARRAVQEAIDAVAALAGVALTRVSSLYRSAPVDAAGPDFVNAVAEVQTKLTAPALLEALQGIEDAAGRERPYRNAPRTLDLDLLLYGSARIDSPRLTVPHPRMQQRAFVLVPLNEIAPHRVAPQHLAALTSQVIGVLPDRPHDGGNTGSITNGD
jgi:2-amino-4-hydroxy-6-hydroxymethyldihydropteridine diphosphokinase